MCHSVTLRADCLPKRVLCATHEKWNSETQLSGELPRAQNGRPPALMLMTLTSFAPVLPTMRLAFAPSMGTAVSLGITRIAYALQEAS